MTKRATVAAIAALLALSGCERLGIGGGNTSSVNASGGKDVPAGNQQASADAPPPPGGKDPNGAVPAASNDGGAALLNRAYVVGRWTDNGDCSDGVDLASDGSFTTTNGARGVWNLRDDRLTMTGASTITFQIIPVDQDTMNVVNQDGSLGRSTRC